MSPGFRLAAARQASIGSSKSCQDCVQYTQQSLMKSKGCEATREDPVPPQAKRYRYRGTLHHHLPAIDKMTTSKHFGLHCLIDTGSRLLPEEALQPLQSANFFFSFSYLVRHGKALIQSSPCRQKVCSQAFQVKSPAHHRGMRQQELDLGNALHPSEHAAEGSQPRQENNPACQLDALSCKSSAGRLC